MNAGIGLVPRLKQILTRKPTTDEETQGVVDEIDQLIRELETLQMWLYKSQQNRNEKLPSEEIDHFT
jgi:hypothetical protein